MSVVKFSYQDAKGQISERELIQWSENSSHIQGRCAGDTFPKSYRKDRILAFLAGSELLLGESAPPAPKPKPFELAAAAAAAGRVSRSDYIGTQNQILFTGFSATERVDLEAQAVGYGMKIVKTPVKALTFLCYGENAGPTKVAKAQEAGAFIIDSEEFQHLLLTGELP